MTVHIPFDNSYSRLPQDFYTRQNPSPVAEPGLIAVNDALAEELGIDPGELRSPEGVEVLAGNRTPAGADPLAQVYAGHQFAGWVPRLGDGRAVLLGEVIDKAGKRRDIQLKGAGRTPYSRGGDGRAWLGPVLREYLVSEAMHAFGIPTTRALAAVTTGQEVLRETALPGAILTRVADSHVRVGTFQYFAARQDIEALQALTEYVIARHYPDAATPLDLLNAVIARQAGLIARWMGVGFIHGVMNTDNMAVSGETIDYGPCAFMDAYHPETVYSSIDSFGRYAYFRQPEIAVWNLAQFASCLLPLMGEKDAAIAAATQAVHRFPVIYADEYLTVFRAKIGLTSAEDGDAALIQNLLDWMAASGADFTNTFRAVSGDVVPDGLADWARQWRDRRDRDRGDAAAIMAAANPAFIPRNHRIEQAIEAAVGGNLAPFHRLSDVLMRPFSDQPDAADLQRPPEPEEVVQRTFCGT
ncbi:MAG: YdiU family protein [Paracoccaceae bacterium]